MYVQAMQCYEGRKDGREQFVHTKVYSGTGEVLERTAVSVIAWRYQGKGRERENFFFTSSEVAKEFIHIVKSTNLNFEGEQHRVYDEIVCTIGMVTNFTLHIVELKLKLFFLDMDWDLLMGKISEILGAR